MNGADPTADAVIAVVVSYFPDADFRSRVRKLAEEVDCILVVDNGDTGRLKTAVLQDCSDLALEIISNGGNLGIARALNIGVDRARALGARWVATFDQDSEIVPGYRNHMLQAWRGFPERRAVALLTPVHRHKSLEDAVSAHGASDAGSREQPREVRSAMTSGNFVPCTTYDLAGPYREDFVIDYVDHEFCLRCRKAGLRIVEVPNAVLHHQLGCIRRESLGPIAATVTHHDEMRRYFITRNRMSVWRLYASVDPLWVMADMVGSAKDLIKILLFEERKATKLRCAFLGMVDAMRSRMGWGSMWKWRFPGRAKAG